MKKTALNAIPYALCVLLAIGMFFTRRSNNAEARDLKAPKEQRIQDARAKQADVDVLLADEKKNNENLVKDLDKSNGTITNLRKQREDLDKEITAIINEGLTPVNASTGSTEVPREGLE